MFADDTNLFFSENCYERVFQVANAELKSVDNWLTAKTMYLMTGNYCLIYYVTASFVYKRSFTPFRSDAYEKKPRCLDLLHAFFAPNALFLDKIGHKTLKNHKRN